MRMGFANENLVAIAELGGDVVGHRHGHVPGHVQEGVYCVSHVDYWMEPVGLFQILNMHSCYLMKLGEWVGWSRILN